MANDGQHEDYPRWPTPPHRDVGLFSSASVYGDALALAREAADGIDVQSLQSELRPRLRGLAESRPKPRIEDEGAEWSAWYGVSKRVAEDVLRELLRFSWVRHLQRPGGAVRVALTEEGEQALRLYRDSPTDFRREVTWKLADLYVVPGWFVYRLWRVNPEGQGEVFLPSPDREWQPASWKWDESAWSEDLQRVTRITAERAQGAFPLSFPTGIEAWEKRVRHAWERLAAQPPSGRPPSDGEKQERRFRPRLRLSTAMQAASIAILFDITPPGARRPDIGARRYIISPKTPRTFRLWCSRLEDLNLLFYTDYLPDCPGRVTFPVSVFLPEAPSPDFVAQPGIRSPEGHTLYYHLPRWEQHSGTFLEALEHAHRRTSRRVGALYVSFLDVRDEVCRSLRISAMWFEEMFERAFRASLAQDSQWTISIESDIREDQRGGAAQLRRPVWQNGVPYSLVAMASRESISSNKDCLR